MAKYTMELRKIQARFYAAMQDYPIFDESYRETLNDRIYHACKMREIGFETPELFLEQLAYWMDLHMPEYNWQYKANMVELTPLQRSQIMETMNRIKNYDENSNRNEIRNSNKEMTSETENEANTQQSQIGYSKETSKNESENTDSLNALSHNEQSSSNKNENMQNSNELGHSTESTENNNVSNTQNNGITQSTEESENTTDNNESVGNVNISNEDTENVGYHSDFPQGNLTDSTDSNYYTTGDKDNGKSQSKTTDNTNTVGNTVENGETKSTTENSENGSSIENLKGEREVDNSTTTNTIGSSTENGESISDDSKVENRNSVGSENGEKESNNTQNTIGSTLGKSANTVNESGAESNSMTDGKMGNEAETEVKSKLTGDGYSDFELLDQYRKAFVNVDNQIIRALKKALFMNIW